MEVDGEKGGAFSEAVEWAAPILLTLGHSAAVGATTEGEESEQEVRSGWRWREEAARHRMTGGAPSAWLCSSMSSSRNHFTWRLQDVCVLCRYS